MRAAALICSLSRLFARDWPRGAGFCLAVIACLSQLSAPGQHWLAQSVAASFSGYSALDTRSGFAPAPFDAVHASVPCAAHRSGTAGSNGPAPCHGDCPFCPCCATSHAGVGILPQEMSRIAYARPFSELGPPPLRLGSSAHFDVIAGQPRAPPFLI
jgi:hypothetical protein